MRQRDLGDILGGILGGGQQRTANEAVAPDGGNASEPELQPQAVPQAVPQGVPQGQSSGSEPQPGELIDIDLPGQQGDVAQDGQPDAQKNDGGLGGLLGGLFGKK